MKNKQQKWLSLLLGMIWGLSMSACTTLPSPDETPMAGPEKSYANIHEAFTVHDTDGNGYLDQQEFIQLQNDPIIVRSRQMIPEMRDNPPLFDEIDENRDNQISLEELTAVIFPILPINGDGKSGDKKNSPAQ